MPQTTCPHCARTLRFDEQHLGRKARCPQCRETISLGEKRPAAAKTATASAKPTRSLPRSRTRAKPEELEDLDDLEEIEELDEIEEELEEEWQPPVRSRKRKKSRRKASQFDLGAILRGFRGLDDLVRDPVAGAWVAGVAYVIGAIVSVANPEVAPYFVLTVSLLLVGTLFINRVVCFWRCVFDHDCSFVALIFVPLYYDLYTWSNEKYHIHWFVWLYSISVAAVTMALMRNVFQIPDGFPGVS